MKIEGRYTFQAPIEAVYDALRDEALIRQALPGQVRFDMTTPTHYEAAMDLQASRFSGRYEGSLDVVETQRPTLYRLEARGTGLGRFVTAQGTVTLRETEPGQTEVHYIGTTDALAEYNRFIQMAAAPIAAGFANRGLRHLEQVILARRQASGA